MADRISTPAKDTQGGFRLYEADQLLQWLLFLRVVVATFVLGRVFILGISQARQAFFILITTHVLTALLSALFVRRYAAKSWFLHLQIYWDVLFISGLVYLSGGVDSFFPFMYVLAVINASILLPRRATNICGGVCSALMAAIFFLQWSHVINLPNDVPGEPATARDVILKLVFHVFAIFAAAYLSGFLSERGRDVSAQLQQKQEALEQLRVRFEHMIRSIPIGLLALDDQENVLFANLAARGILGSEVGDPAGYSLRELIPGLPVEFTREPGQLVWATTRREGRNTYLEVGLSPLTSEDGARLGALVTLEDRTLVRAMEDAVRRTDRLAAVGKLAAGIAHEIRNPLASMSGSIQLLSKELKLDSVNAHLMDIVLRETERLNALVNDFLAFARPGPMKEELIDARTIVRETLQMIANEPACRDSGVRILEELPEPLFLRADANQLRQLIWNLAINAVQAMPTGGELMVAGRVLANEEGDQNGSSVIIEVRDQGIGIDEDILKAVFDPFFTTKERGTGLGLTTCHSIVEMYDGSIKIESAAGQGSTFTVTIPAA